ncbi:MAG: M48 family metallopeptidase [Pseudomonadota bacterium]
MVKGSWYFANHSRRYDAELTLRDDQICVKIEGESPRAVADSSVRISDRVANIPRRVVFEDGAVFVSDDNDRLDDLLSDRLPSDSPTWLHRLESSWKWASFSILAIVFVSVSAYLYGLPWATDKLVAKVPDEMRQNLSNETLSLLDRFMLSESQLSESRQDELRKRFTEISKQALARLPNTSRYLDAPEQAISFHFRSMGMPNAFALPDGQIVIADELVKLSKNQHEIDAVVLHELGHVVHQHGMNQAVRSFFVTVVIALVVGDPSGMEELLVALPTALAQGKYSRDHEREADVFAFDAMDRLQIDTEYFATIMERMSVFDRSPGDETEQNEPAESGLWEYFQTHPGTADRIRAARERSR